MAFTMKNDEIHVMIICNLYNFFAVMINQVTLTMIDGNL